MRDDSYEVSVGQALEVPAPGVLANDADPNGGGALSAAKLTDPDKGSVSAFNADGGFTYVAPTTPVVGEQATESGQHDGDGDPPQPRRVGPHPSAP